MADGAVDGLGFGDLEAEAEEGSSRWLHVPARERLRVVILSERAFRYEGHWINGRMRVCPGPGCVWHARRMGVQPRYCLSVLDIDARVRAFIEIGSSTAIQISRAASEAGRLRGLIFELRHEGERRAGRLIATAQEAWSAMGLLMEAEDAEPQIRRQALAERSTEAVPSWDPEVPSDGAGGATLPVPLAGAGLRSRNGGSAGTGSRESEPGSDRYSSRRR